MRRSGIATDLTGNESQKLPTNCQHKTLPNAIFIYYNCQMPKREKTIVNIDSIRVFFAYLFLTLYGLRPRVILTVFLRKYAVSHPERVV
jgi:hypothetical protein